MDNTFPTELLEEFNHYFKKVKNNTVVNIDKSLRKHFDFQIQRFEDAVKVFKGGIPPNRFSHFYFAIVTNGQGIKSVGLTEFKVVPNSLIFIPSGTIHSSHSFTPDTEGYILSFSSEYVLENYTNKNFLNELPFYQIESQPFLLLTDADKDVLLGIIQNISTEYLNYNTNKDFLLRLYILELLVKTERIYRKQTSQIETQKESPTRLIKEFKRLLEKHFLQEKSVFFYAQELATHPNHLNATVKNATGKTCSQLIHDRIILEAKCLLQSTELSVKEIAAYLSFEDTSYFSKYFKKLTNESPLDYRNKPNL